MGLITDQLQELQALLYKEIPITKHLHLTVGAYNEHALRLDAPLAENVNHAGTAFGGSLSALLTLAGWSMAWFVLQESKLSGEIVIQDSSCKYLRPVKQDFSAICYRPPAAQIIRFDKMLRTHKKARLELQAEIHESNTLSVTFQGRYVVFLQD
ncbi:YiiD C-terminal domain-containing protein [Dictyobacter vulcani]|nr:YiiD C-terminal domain-containing protein [Dictyobacter vulcani]